jgi:glyoxylase-like metal-dependent hydrolase (beta-lactamase superfamily II)
MTTGVKRVILLTLGWEDLPKAWSVHGTPPEERLVEPVPALLVEVDGGWVLLETGFNPALILDPPLRRRYHDSFYGIEPILPPGGDPLLEALEREGVPIEAIDAVAVSHLHNDHAGGVRHFAGRTPVHLQKAELEFGIERSVEAERNGYCRIDYDDPRIDWYLADGDVEVAPGVSTVLTPGHTPGHQSFVVRYDEAAGGGGFVFAADAADLTENVAHELPIGGVIDCDPATTVDNIRKLKDLSAREGLRLVPGHDPVVWPALTEELAQAGGFLRRALA